MDYTYTVNQSSPGKLQMLRSRFAALFSRSNGTYGGSVPATASWRNTIFSRTRIGTYLFVIIVGIAVIGAVRLVLARRPAVSGISTITSSQTDTKSVVIDREFSLPVYDKDKKISDPIRYIITDAQLTKQIIIKGQKATAVKDRMFFIINLRLVNDFNQSLFLNTRNYIRIQPLGATDKLAPEIHNDTVEVQPLSTKLTRLGVPVNETDTQFTLYVGEIEGEKQEINVSF